MKFIKSAELDSHIQFSPFSVIPVISKPDPYGIASLRRNVDIFPLEYKYFLMLSKKYKAEDGSYRNRIVCGIAFGDDIQIIKKAIKSFFVDTDYKFKKWLIIKLLGYYPLRVFSYAEIFKRLFHRARQ